MQRFQSFLKKKASEKDFTVMLEIFLFRKILVSNFKKTFIEKTEEFF